MDIWWWHRCVERNAGVDVKPGEEDGEGGVERALCKKSSKSMARF